MRVELQRDATVQDPREAHARAALVANHGAVGLTTGLCMTCIAAAEDDATVDVFSELFECNAKPYSNHFTQEQIAALEMRISNGDKCLACDKQGVLWCQHSASTMHAKQRVWRVGRGHLMGPTAGPRPFGVGYGAKDGILEEWGLVLVLALTE